MSSRAKIYIVAILLAAASVTAYALMTSRVSDPVRLIAYTVAALIAAGMKVSLPGITGTMSVSYVFILIAIAELSLGEVVLIAALSSIVQSVWYAKKRPQPVHLAFNAASISLSSAAAYAAYHYSAHLTSDHTLQLGLQLASASGTYFLLNTFSIAGVVALTENGKITSIWRNGYFWSFPYYMIGASITALMRYLSNFFDWKLSLFVFPVVYVIFRSYRLYLGQLEREKHYAEEMAALHLRTIEALALAIETKDHTTGTHLRRVQVYAREIAKELSLDESETKALQAASILHDIGKLAVPDYIISKPGRLTPEEFEKMKIHPIVGAEILATINFPYPVVPIVRAHHEKWDGSGYPDGLRDTSIPLGARILACVDCFDALASDRQYRKALPLPEALAVVQRESGRSFDPAVVTILARRYLELEQLAGAEPIQEPGKLSLEVKIARGEAPDSGFQGESARTSAQTGGSPLHSVAAAREQVQALYELTKSIGPSLSVTETLSVIATRIKGLVPYDTIVIYLREGTTLTAAYVNGENHKLFSSLRLPLGEGLSGWVAENRKPILNGNPSVEPGYLQDPSKFSTLRSALSLPLETPAGVIGVLGLYRAEKDGFSGEDLRVLQAINSKLSIAIENAVRDQPAAGQVQPDALTLLPHAGAAFLHLEAELAWAAARQNRLAVLVCDVDGFKQVNDRLGHRTGDRILQTLALRLSDDSVTGEYPARMGGDEFLVVLPDTCEAEVESKIERISSMVRRVSMEISGDPLLGVSVGVAFYPDDGTNTETLLAQADRRLYSQKAEHKRTNEREPMAHDLARLEQSIVASDAPSTPVAHR